jgi:hypothetical protein
MNNWHMNNELPPVGLLCNYLMPGEEVMQAGVIKAHVCGKTAIIDFGESWAASEEQKRFFPILDLECIEAE